MEPTIITEGLRKRFGDVAALDGFDLVVRPGTVHGLLGPNGAGKTTAVRVLTTLLRPDGGRAWVAGFDVLRDPGRVRSRIGLVGQNPAVDEVLTGRQNLELFGRLYHLGARPAARRAVELLDRFDLADAGDKPAGQYSGGMRRRLDLAAGMILTPAVLFLDEPTTGLDPRGRASVWAAIRGLVAAGTTVLLTTQYLDEADQLAGRIGVINHGRLVSEGAPEQLKSHTGPAVLELSIPDSQQDAAMQALGQIAPAVYDRHRGTFVLPATDGVATLQHALRALEAAAITPTDVGLHRPTLDDVFLALTGTDHTDRDLNDPVEARL